MPHSSGIRLLDAGTPTLVEHVSTLFRRYAAEFAGSIAESLCLQGFELELAGLPRQVRATRRLPLAGAGL